MTLSSSLTLLLVSRCLSEGVAPSPGSPPVPGSSSSRGPKESTKLYGNINKYAYYFTDLYVGSPNPQRTSVIVDTGSRIAGFPCKGCQHCGSHIDAPFDVNLSKTARWLRCGEGCTTGCVDGQCTYQETYSEGSSIIGRYFNDEVELGDTLNRFFPVPTRLGCHNSEDKLFYTQKANGIMGLAPTASDAGASTGGAPTVLQDLFKDRAHIGTKIFSMCLASWGGRLTVGGDNAAYHSAPISWIRMLPTQYYFIFPTAMSLDPQTSGQPPSSAVQVGSRSADFGVTIVDSGTTYTYFPEPLFNNLVATLVNYCKEHNGCGAKRQGTECWRLDNPALGPSLFPEFKMFFEGGGTVTWAARGYLHERGEPGVWCQTFLENNLYQTVLGISWMLHKDVIFDIASNKLGVAFAKCPEYHREDQLDFEKKFEWVPVRGPRPIDVEAEMGMSTVVIGLVATLASGIILTRLHRRLVTAAAELGEDDHFEAASSLADFEEAGYEGSSGPLLVME